MNRRNVILGGSGLVTAICSGCIDRFNSSEGSQRNPERIQFDEAESQYKLVIQNDLSESVEAKISVNQSSNDGKEKTVSVESAESRSFTNLLSTGGGPYTISVAADGKTKEITLDPTGSPRDEFTFTISDSEITFQKGYRPTPHIAISNKLDEAVDVRIEVKKASNGRTVFDVLTVSSNEIVTYRGVFWERDEYHVTVEFNEMSESTSHRNSETNTLHINIDTSGIQFANSSA